MTTNPTPEDLIANLKARPHPKQTHLEMAGGFAYITINDHKIAYDGEQWFACSQMITPRFSMNSLHQEIDRVFRLAQKIKDHVLNTTTKEQTTMIDQSEQTFVSTDRYRELEAELKTVTEERDRLKSKADLLSVVSRRLCGDENASIETVHKALDLFDDQRNALDYIGEKVGSVPFHLGEVQSLVAQAIKSLGEKTVENAKLQEGVKNYEAQLKGYAANKRLQILDRITKILRDAEIATVYDYEENRAIETDERVRILCERLKQKTVEWRDDAAKMHKLVDEIRQTHLTLNEMNAPRCMGTIDLSLSARIRSLFTTHTKV
jgi:hypothetical protein